MWVIFERKNIVQDDIPVAVLGFTAAGLAQSVECLTAEREVADSNPGAEPILPFPYKQLDLRMTRMTT